MKDTKSGELSSKLVSNHTSLTSNLKHNLLAYMSNITQKELADKSGISFDTLKNLLYQNPKDCKLSTAASLAHALNLTIDELVGADTLSEEDESCIRMFRSMPEHYQYFVRWFICRQYQVMKSGYRQARKTIPIMDLDEHTDGTFHISGNLHSLDITDIPANIKPQIFCGLSVNTNYYMPFCSPFDTLLIANDRPPKANENSVIVYGDNVFIARRSPFPNASGVHEYYSIRDGKFRCLETDIDDVLRYIPYVFKPRW